jgi:hypothetical protein
MHFIADPRHHRRDMISVLKLRDHEFIAMFLNQAFNPLWYDSVRGLEKSG